MEDIFVTDDAVLVRGVGFMDPDDVALIGGHRVMSMEQAYAHALTEGAPDFIANNDEALLVNHLPSDPLWDPNRFGGKLPDETTPEGYIGLDRDHLEELSEHGTESVRLLRVRLSNVFASFTSYSRDVRRLRCERHYSWRAIARWCRPQPGFRMVDGWGPDANQLAGMVACELAAELLDEDWTAAPWNDLPLVTPSSLGE